MKYFKFAKRLVVPILVNLDNVDFIDCIIESEDTVSFTMWFSGGYTRLYTVSKDEWEELERISTK